MSLRRPKLFIVLGVLLHGCSDGEATTRNETALSILNGPSHAEATSHWVAQSGCNNGNEVIEITADGNARYTYSSANPEGTPTTWTQTSKYNLMFGKDSGLAQLQSIAGSVEGGAFSALSLHANGEHAVCEYSLVAGKLGK